MKPRMNMNQSDRGFRRIMLPLLLASCCLFLASCNLPAPQADTVRYFTLGRSVVVTPVADSATVRPVQLAGHLHGREMVVRISAHEVVYLDDVRWAESLDVAITEVLRNRLGTVPGGATVSVVVQRCELVRSEGNTVQLAANYSVVPANGDKTAPRRGAFTATPRAWDGKDYAALIALLRESVGELAEALAKAAEAP
jgi:uncharacterized lipoprotein YmbA